MSEDLIVVGGFASLLLWTFVILPLVFFHG
jgi:hypothetical protein